MAFDPRQSQESAFASRVKCRKLVRRRRYNEQKPSWKPRGRGKNYSTNSIDPCINPLELWIRSRFICHSGALSHQRPARASCSRLFPSPSLAATLHHETILETVVSGSLSESACSGRGKTRRKEEAIRYGHRSLPSVLFGKYERRLDESVRRSTTHNSLLLWSLW